MDVTRERISRILELAYCVAKRSAAQRFPQPCIFDTGKKLNKQMPGMNKKEDSELRVFGAG